MNTSLTTPVNSRFVVDIDATDASTSLALEHGPPIPHDTFYTEPHEMAVSKEKITVYNLADLKNTSDDAIPNYLNSLKFTQSHTLTDVRLSLGYGAFFIAAACFLWDYKLGFESTKYYTAAAVTVYSLLNTALTLWIWLKEKGIVYVGTSPNGETVRSVQSCF